MLSVNVYQTQLTDIFLHIAQELWLLLLCQSVPKAVKNIYQILLKKMMTEFQICADFTHLLAIFLLIRKMYVSQSCAGISGKSQLLFTTVFISRYLDFLIFTTFISIYNTVFKLAFIGLALFILYLIFFRFHKTYDSDNDSFWITLILFNVSVLSFFVNYVVLYHRGNYIDSFIQCINNNFFELSWTFSIYLEAVAILPQFYMIRKTGDGQNVLPYIIGLAVYRGLYVCNWIYRYFAQNHYDPISFVAGTVQTALLIMVVIYIQMRKRNRPKWQEITDVFTIEAAKFDESEKAHLPSFVINDQSRKEDGKHLLS